MSIVSPLITDIYQLEFTTRVYQSKSKWDCEKSKLEKPLNSSI